MRVAVLAAAFFFALFFFAAPALAPAARLAAKVPARRVAAALERLLALYRDEGEAESVDAVFARVPLPRVKSLLADLEVMTADTATPEDYVDLGGTGAFVPEVMEGECAS